MATFLRFRDLVARGVFNNRMTLLRSIDNYGFPAGRFIGPNTRVWTEAEVNAWLESRPVSRRRKAAAHRQLNDEAPAP